jgi:glutamyl-tRNA synthetase
MTAVPRVRFCPAPSGWLHVGSARTALYNWLAARHSGGTFVFRIEDTDAERVSEESMHGMMEGLRFLGLEWDEGPDIGGPYGPYRQSERSDLYAAVADSLYAAGHAYEAFEAAEELRAEREAAAAAGRPPGYAGGHRDLTEEQRAAYRAEGRKPVLRLRTPDAGSVGFHDVIRGSVEVAWKDIPDFVIRRADGSSTYYLANTVDDLAQGITLIARGEDLLSATPRQRLLAGLLLDGGLLDKVLAETGYPVRPDLEEPGQPKYAHLPLLVGKDRAKLSKRHGAVAIEEFRTQGYLPEVLVNMLALCGWSYDGVQEKFTVEELVAKFTIDRVGRNPALFDTAKLRALNGDRIKELSVPELAERLVPYFVDADVVGDPPNAAERGLIGGFTPLLQQRIQTLAEAVPLVAFAFRDEVVFDTAATAKHLKGGAGEALEAAYDALAAAPEWQGDALEQVLFAVADRLGVGKGKVMQPVRVAVTGTAVSPPLPQTLAVLDRDLVLARIRAARSLVKEG